MRISDWSSDVCSSDLPTSNLFIGSGLFDLAKAQAPAFPLRVALATDVGGGTSYSMLRTLGEGYKVLQLQDQNLPALQRSEERRVGKGCVSTFRYRGSPYH